MSVESISLPSWAGLDFSFLTDSRLNSHIIQPFTSVIDLGAGAKPSQTRPDETRRISLKRTRLVLAIKPEITPTSGFPWSRMPTVYGIGK